MRNIFILFSAFFFLFPNFVYAGSATWNSNPVTNKWNLPANWIPNTVPDGSADVATFDSSNITDIVLGGATEVNTILFNPGAGAYTLSVPRERLLKVIGVGISNNSGVTQNIVLGSIGVMRFYHAATAGDQVVYTLSGGRSGFSGGGVMAFLDSTTAGNATFVVEGGPDVDGVGGYLQIFRDSNAGSATFICNGGAFEGSGGGSVQFGGNFNRICTAASSNFTLNGGEARGAYGGSVGFIGALGGNATFTINGAQVPGANPALVLVDSGTDLENATLIAKGGLLGAAGGEIRFYHDGHGGQSQIELLGNSNLYITGSDAASVKIGSLAGTGAVSLGANTLAVGSNNLDTEFSGVINDLENHTNQGGGLAKIGTGTLTLHAASTYTGTTTVSRGKLMVDNTTGSGTGRGPVLVNGGALGGTGQINGDVTIGTGSGGPGAFLSPGRQLQPGALIIRNSLTFNPEATYDFGFDSDLPTGDQVSAKSITINAGAQISFSDIGGSVISPGTGLTAINNLGSTPISGNFSNLADGASITVGSNTFRANYEGGDGNDLTLTVIP